MVSARRRERHRWRAMVGTSAIIFSAACLFAPIAGRRAVAQEVVSNASIGVTLTKPSNWTLVSEAARDAAQRRDRNDFKDFIFKNMSRPFLIMIKEGPRTIVPTISALVAPLPPEFTQDPVANLERMSGGGRKASKNYKIMEPGRNVT